MKKFTLICCALSALILIPAANKGAAPDSGAAPLFAQTAGRNEVSPVLAGLPRTVRFREVEGRGLLVSAWINGAGPFTFAVDTGAGATILSGRVAAEAHLVGGRSVTIGGMSGTGSVGGNETVIRSLAVGDAGNLLPSKKPVIVTERLAPGVDGVIDPAEAYWPLGFEIDMARGEMSAFDPRVDSLRRASNFPPDGAIVPWLTDGQSRRPFVMLEGGRRALIDTGSGFGLALTEEAASSLGIIPGGRQRRGDIRDLAGGSIPAHRISPTTVRLGTLVLRGVPTDLLPAARAGSPILLGRDALRPFRLSFDPLARLIRIIPG